MNRDWIGIGAGLVLTGVIGFGLGAWTTEEKQRKKYEEASASMRKAYELARQKPLEERPAETEGELIVIDTSMPAEVKDAVSFDTLTSFSPAMTNPYHSALATEVEAFVNGEVVNGLSYIEEEEFELEDDRDKHHVTMIVDDHQPVFFLDGMLMADWEERLGASIVTDLFSRTPPQLDERILYVRNHRLGEDYEVSLERE